MDNETRENELIWHFVCGALLGLVIAIVAMISLALRNQLLIALVFVGSMFGCGLAAVMYGGRFWKGIAEVDID